VCGNSKVRDPISGVLQKTYGYAYDPAANRTLEQASTHGGAQQEITLSRASYNSLNQMTSRTGGSGALEISGTVSEPAQVSIAGQPASAFWKRADGQYGFRGTAQVSSGANQVAVTATDGSGNQSQTTIQAQVSGTAIPAMTYDDNGNLLFDGTRHYDWDAANRLIAIRYDGAAGQERTEFTYDGLSRAVRRTEIAGGAISEMRHILWEALTRVEERTGATGATVHRRFFAQGEEQQGAQGAQPWLYRRDHLGSVRELVDLHGATRLRADFDLWGRRTVTGTKMHRSENQAPGVIHQHFFFGATETLPVAAGDKLVSYVYLNPANPPTQIMLQWHATDGSGWEHRAYWGANQIPWGTDGTESRRYQGPLPAAGQWVRLEIDAASVGLSGRSISGMAYSQVGGQADWNHSGKVSATGVETTYVDDTLPAGATPYGTWTWGDTGLSTPVALTGHHYHPRSTLHLAPYRAYSAELGRWLSRDPKGESEGSNLYRYSINRTITHIDPNGDVVFLAPLLVPAAGSAIAAAAKAALATAAVLAAGALLERSANQAASDTVVVVIDPPIDDVDDRNRGDGDDCDFFFNWCAWGIEKGHRPKDDPNKYWCETLPECLECYEQCKSTGVWPFEDCPIGGPNGPRPPVEAGN
jgi:RHS repeat-associated protein